jgi:hypothetical protein
MILRSMDDVHITDDDDLPSESDETANPGLEHVQKIELLSMKGELGSGRQCEGKPSSDRPTLYGNLSSSVS